MYDHNGGDDNIAIGSSAMKDGEGNGADNIAIGTEALKNIGAGAARNIAIGGDAQKTQNGSATDNISIGYQSLYNNTVGDYNVAVGTETLYSVNDPSGHKNVGVGYRAGLFIANGSTEFTSGSSNVFIGAHAYPNAINDSNEVVIGANAIGKGSNTVTIGDDGITDIYLSEDKGAIVYGGTFSGSAFIDDGTQLNVPDYVFEPEYDLKSLEYIETHISQSKHLPGVPSRDDKQSWVTYDMGGRDMLLLEKIEELTLYVIRLEKRIKDLENN
jgi:hypothetical protein